MADGISKCLYKVPEQRFVGGKFRSAHQIDAEDAHFVAAGVSYAICSAWEALKSGFSSLADHEAKRKYIKPMP